MKVMKTEKNRKVKLHKMLIAQMVLIVLSILLFLWYLAPYYFNHILNAGNGLGMGGSVLMLLCGVFLPKLTPLVRAPGAMGIGAKAVLALFCAGSAVVCVVFGSMLLAQQNTPGRDETVIVLGCSVKGEHPSRMLRQRIEAAAAYLKANDGAVAVLSGGQGPDEIMTEAECMRRELVKRGIAENRLYLEEKSTNTKENIAFSAKIIRAHRLPEKVAVVTSDFHEKRGAMLCKENGLTPSAVPAKTDFYLAGTYWLREILGVIKEFLF